MNIMACCSVATLACVTLACGAPEQLEAWRLSIEPEAARASAGEAVQLAGTLTVRGSNKDFDLELIDDDYTIATLSLHTSGRSPLHELTGRRVELEIGDRGILGGLIIRDEQGPVYVADGGDAGTWPRRI